MLRISDIKIWVRLTASIWALLIVVWAGMIFWDSHNSRKLAVEQAMDFSLSMHDSALAGLTAMMITETMHKKHVLLDQISHLAAIRELRVVPGELAREGVESSKNEGKPRNDLKPNELEAQVLRTGEAYVEVREDKEGTYLLAIRPTKNVTKYLGKNCVECHDAPENATIGTIGIKISLDKTDQAITAKRFESLGVALVASLVVLLFIWSFIRGAVTGPLERMVAGLRAIVSGEGDLTRRLEVRGSDEIGIASAVFNEMMAKIAGLVRHVGESAAQVSTAAAELVVRADQVVASSQSQSATSATTAQAVEQMVASIATVARSAEEVRQLSRESLRRSDEGNSSLTTLDERVGMVETTVRGIADSVGEFVSSTKAITHITSEVKELAEQTNLLALNAAIEAARAGEQGRGFAVVADEVRKLAEKSASSANEIDTITHTLGKQSEQVTRAIADAMDHIATSRESMMTVNGVLAAASESVVAVGRGLDSIAAATQEQERVSADVFSGIERIKQTAQGNSEAAGQTAAAARNMGALAGELQGAVGRFHT
ncbi:putative methyl-accepting chemotaxis protein YoaH [Azoarcus sp. Aa7]|nr:putative methyl-accepting chemotaxis protein YoaH [Azoarcus sp. Aa7]